VQAWESEAMTQPEETALRGDVVEESVQLTLTQLCQACHAEVEVVVQLVQHGVLEPRGAEAGDWRFAGDSLRRSRVALRLMRDLGVNEAGAALALELMAQIDQLRALLPAAPGTDHDPQA
jgi:chaperone modulatory protein CbpM